MHRRDLIALALSAPLTPLAAQAGAPLAASGWAEWRGAFLTDEGRVVDALQRGASHSEGQSYGLLLAEAHGDLDAFEKIERWTRAHLLVRDDALMGWRWIEGEGVPDWHIATDGDLFRAWALLRAGLRFARPDFTELAHKIAAEIAGMCITPDPRGGDRLVLLPGDPAYMLGEGGAVTFNPSYIMPRAMDDLAAATGIERLARAASDGLALIDELAAQGPIPDWVELHPGGIRPAAGRNGGSGYDAIRVPLYLVWSGRGDARAVTAAAEHLPSDAGRVVVARRADGSPDETSDLAGYRAIAALARCAAGFGPGAIPPYEPGQPYYPATLHLLAELAAREAALACPQKP
ncbi:MAG: glycosyl hydrolase family 8 [Paracoccus sp. (in: a-proteobacteria)]|nr:glycosyl hydrolase family 8 [Paracoccus sp. (in: a-proteobacteria)]